MNRIKSFIVALIIIIVGVPAFGLVANLFVPGLGEVFLFVDKMLLMLIKNYVLKEKLAQYGIFLLLFILLHVGGIYLSKKEENVLFEIVAIIISVVGVITGNIL